MLEVRELVARYGSPLYVYRLDRVRGACADLRADLPVPSTLYYSLKANPHPAVVECLRRAGCRAEVSSPGELAAALAAGFRGGQCMFTGPGKTAGELRDAIAHGVIRFSVESLTDLHRLAGIATAAGTTVESLIRVNVAAAAGTSGLRMTGAPSQFGVDVAGLYAGAGAFTDVPGVRVIGAHFFPVSNARSEDGLLAELTASIRAAARLRDELDFAMSVVDLGSGFASPYAQPGDRPRYRRLRAALEPVLDDFLPGWRDGAVEIAFESGRYLAGDCGSLIATVTDVKRSKGRRFVVLDTGIHHLGGMAGLGRLLPVGAVVHDVPAGAGTGPVPSAAGTAEPDRGALVGPLCTPADVLARDTAVGHLAAGDIVEIPNAGAYGLTASLLAFLGRPIAVEVVVDQGDVCGASRLELGRVPVAELLPGGVPPAAAVPAGEVRP